jgi:hypothetical protein
MTTLTQLLKISGSAWVDDNKELDGVTLYTPRQNSCIADIIERYDDCPEALLDFDRSDWVNMAECYTYQSLERWNQQEEDVMALFNEYCEAIGATSTIHALEGICDGFYDGDDMNCAIVNLAMTWGATELQRQIASYAYEHTELGGQLWESFRSAA